MLYRTLCELIYVIKHSGVIVVRLNRYFLFPRLEKTKRRNGLTFVILNLYARLDCKPLTRGIFENGTTLE